MYPTGIAGLEPTMPEFENVIGHQAATFLAFGRDPELFPRPIMIAIMLLN
jgi:hypothetical protein